MDMSVLIVNYNSADVTKQAVDAVLKQKGLEFELIVADNNSHDNSLKMLESYADKIVLIANQDNLGYGKANNQAAALAKGRYLCIMNPDTIFENEEDLLAIKNYLDANPTVGLAGTKLLDFDDNPEAYDNEYYPGERHVKNRFNDLPGDIAWVYGAMMIARKDVFEKVHGFDEDYFLHGEDADLCIRIRKAGYSIAYLDTIFVRHIGAVSYKDIDLYLTKTRKMRGLFIFYCKHYTLAQARRMIRYRYWKSMSRLITLKVSRLIKDTPKKENKFIRYKASFDLARNYLKNELVK